MLLLNAGVVQKLIALGYGKHIEDIIATNPQNMRPIITYLQVAAAIVRLSVALARVSFGITLLHLSKRGEKLVVWFAIVSLLAVVTPAVILPFVACRPYAKIFDKSIPGVCIRRGVSVGYFYFSGGS